MVFRMPYAVMTGTVVGVTALIPVVGAYIGAVVGAFMVFTVNPLQALFFILFLIYRCTIKTYFSPFGFM